MKKMNQKSNFKVHCSIYTVSASYKLHSKAKPWMLSVGWASSSGVGVSFHRGRFTAFLKNTLKTLTDSLNDFLIYVIIV